MNGPEILLLILAGTCVLGFAVFLALWLQAKGAREALAKIAEVTSARLGAANGEVERLSKQVRDALRALATERETTTATITDLQRKYRRVAQWEGVEGHKEKEREVKADVDALERTVEALRNVIEGYGSRYVVPPQSLLDELAREMAHTKEADQLKAAREKSRQMVRDNSAAACDATDGARAQLAANLLLDAFNGKVEAALSSVKTDNIGTLKKKLEDAFELVNEHGAAFHHARIQPKYLAARLLELKWSVLVQQKKAEAREEQRRVKDQMREEAKAQREFDRIEREAKQQRQTLDRERALIEEAQAKAVREAKAAYEAELREKLAKVSETQRAEFEAKFRAEMDEAVGAQAAEYEAKLAEQSARLKDLEEQRARAKSMAQQTKQGTVYVISNIGAFGERVFKIGQTRRLDPMDRIWELGDASVPFDFDVHALIRTDDAPKLEGLLHQRFVLNQVNKMNWRKEFFRVDLTEIREVAEKLGLPVDWTVAAAAQQFRETQAIEARFAEDPEFRARWVEDQRGAELDWSEVKVGADEDDSTE